MRNTEINAVRKVLYYTQNYQSVPMTHDITGQVVYVPEVIAKAKWSCSASHIADKWKGFGYDLIKLFFEIDEKNQIAFLDYILENYNGVEDIC